MVFEEAMEQMRKGRVVSRRSWPRFAQNEGIAISERGNHKVLREVVGDAWRRRIMWLPSTPDLFADDWEVVEAVAPSGISTGQRRIVTGEWDLAKQGRFKRAWPYLTIGGLAERFGMGHSSVVTAGEELGCRTKEEVRRVRAVQG